MERLCNLLFELSHEDRLRMLCELQKNAMRLTHLSKTLDLSVQETNRHLSRLSEAKLVGKDVDGLYCITPYGEHAMRLLQGYEFLSSHREYLIAHVIHHLPDEFVVRVGDLVSCSFTDDVMVAFHHTENVIQKAKEYVWILSSQILMSTIPLLEEAVKRGVKFRLILPIDMIPPPGFKPIPTIPNLLERRTLERVDVIIVMSEQKARFAFPTIDGSMDHIGFGSTDESAHEWCKDLFQYYWERAKTGRPEHYPTSD